MNKVELDFKVGDRVIRPGVEGPAGVVQNIRIETIKDSIKKDGQEQPGVAISVLWDNGTLSHFVPSALLKITD
jgi:hypothetical protein